MSDEVRVNNDEIKVEKVEGRVNKAEAAAEKAEVKTKKKDKVGKRGKRKADVVRPGPLYQIIDAIVTIAGLALVGAVILYVIMIFG